MLNDKQKEELLDLTRNMIRTRSYSGEEQGVAVLLKEFFDTHEYDEVMIDEYGNVIGKICGKRPGPHLLFDGHMDTVPVTDEEAWPYPPFEAELHDGKLYGRGTSDMKGALSAMAYAGAVFAKETGKDFAGDIYVAGVVHEECFEGIASRSISRIVRPDCVVIGEASELNIKIGQRGRAEVVVETYGKTAHSSNPEKGINAVYRMCRLVEEIRKLQPPEHPFLGKGILELTDIKSSPYPGASVVPDYCRATFDRRLLVGETKADVLQPVLDLIKKLKKEDPKLEASAYIASGEETCYTGARISGERFFPGWLYNEKDQYIQLVLNELRSAGCDSKITKYNFCTNGSHYAGEAGIRTFGFGPSRENLAHTVGEYVELDQLYGAADGYVRIMKALMKQDNWLLNY